MNAWLAATDRMTREHVIDHLRLRRYRESLFVHDGAAVGAAPNARRLATMHVAATNSTVERHLAKQDRGRRRCSARWSTGSSTCIRAACRSRTWSASSPSTRVPLAAREPRQGAAPAPQRGVCRRDVPLATPARHGERRPDRPRAFAPARWQAPRHDFVVNLRHDGVALADPAMRKLLPLVDGTRDRDALGAALASIAPSMRDPRRARRRVPRALREARGARRMSIARCTRASRPRTRTSPTSAASEPSQPSRPPRRDRALFGLASRSVARPRPRGRVRRRRQPPADGRSYPHARFVGCDYSALLMGRARATVQALGLANLELVEGDLKDDGSVARDVRLRDRARLLFVGAAPTCATRSSRCSGASSRPTGLRSSATTCCRAATFGASAGTLLRMSVPADASPARAHRRGAARVSRPRRRLVVDAGHPRRTSDASTRTRRSAATARSTTTTCR